MSATGDHGGGRVRGLRRRERPEGAAGARGFDVFRLRLGHSVAFVAALALMFIMAGDWYSTADGVRAREIEHNVGKGLPGWGLVDRAAVDDARLEAEKAERNAWQVASFLDALVLVALLATVALAIAAAALQAAGRTFDPRRSPSSAAGAAAAAAFVLVVAQAAARLDPDSDDVFQVGLPLAVMALGAIALGSAMAVRDALDEGEHGGSPPRSRPSGAGPTGGPGAPRGATYNRAP